MWQRILVPVGRHSTSYLSASQLSPSWQRHFGEPGSDLELSASADWERSIQTLVPLYMSIYTYAQLAKQGHVRA